MIWRCLFLLPHMLGLMLSLNRCRLSFHAGLMFSLVVSRLFDVFFGCFMLVWCCPWIVFGYCFTLICCFDVVSQSISFRFQCCVRFSWCLISFMIILNTLQVVLLGRVSMPTSQISPPIKLMSHQVNWKEVIIELRNWGELIYSRLMSLQVNWGELKGSVTWWGQLLWAEVTSGHINSEVSWSQIDLS